MENKISIQDLINVRLALEGIANPTREIVEARQHHPPIHQSTHPPKPPKELP